MTEVDPDTLTPEQTYKLLIGTVLPRPIAWVSTQSVDGVANLAPISFFTVIGRKPPMLSLSIQPRINQVDRKDTFENICETGELVIHLATFELSDELHRSAIDLEPDEDEFEMFGLEKADSVTVAPPRVASAPIAMECKVHKIHTETDIGGIVWARVTRFYFAEGVLQDTGRVDTSGLGVIGRLAAEYTLVDNTFVPPVTGFEVPLRRRIDGKEQDYAAVDQPTWSPSGAVSG